MPSPSDAVSAHRPNIVWVLSEDNSHRFLRRFDSGGTEAPSIERLADHGVVFTRAFSNAPVCSVARTTLVTSIYPPRTAGQFHRKLQEGHLPAGTRFFPAHLGDAGYYRTNRAKKDYNLVEEPGVWDESSNQAHWRNRPSADTPFFHQQNIGVCHESCLHFPADEMDTVPTARDPRAVPIPGFHADTPTMRYAYARYYDIMGEMDRQVGRIVEQLETDGLLEDTFIFYFGDNGGILPGSKGYLWEDGLHVPLVVRIPANFAHLCALPSGSRSDAFVSFVDFGATLLNLAALPVPEVMDGTPFLGPGVTEADLAARTDTYGYADRFDEKYDLCRSLRRGRFKYLRHYQCFYPDGLHNDYRYKMAAFTEWRRLHLAGDLEGIPARFFQPKPPESLFDLDTDPDELHDLAGDPAYSEALSDLRGALQDWVKGLPDLSFLPESVLVDEALGDGIAFGQANRERIAGLVDIADLALVPFDRARAQLEAALTAVDPWERYWGAIVCSCFGEAARPLSAAVRALADDPEALVRVRAAEFLAILGLVDPRPVLTRAVNTGTSVAAVLLALNTAVFVNDHLDGFPVDAAALTPVVDSRLVAQRIAYLRTGGCRAGGRDNVE